MKLLFATYGSLSKDLIEYTTESFRLSLDMKEVLESLGFIVTHKCRLANSIYKCTTYKLHVTGNGYNVTNIDPISLYNIYLNLNTINRKIINIKPVCSRIMKCVTVDADDELFLINSFIPTKNSGKSTLAINVGLHTGQALKIPTLYLDTEMDLEPQQHRILACLGNVHVNEIETGRFAKTSDKKKLYDAQKILSEIPFFHISVAGKPFEEILSIIRRWIIREVGFENGKTKNCLVIYDYFKLMSQSDLNNLQEFQALGFQISHLSDFSKEYDFPCLAFVQLNRSGIEKDTSDIISQSDRLLWLCQSASYIRRKTKEEIVQDGKEHGNVKLQTLECRYGSGLEEGDYINLDLTYGYFRIKETSAKSDIVKQAISSENDNIDF
jgi:hypothetical protein